MIKVLQFIHGLNMGGAETLVKEYALGLDKQKFDITVLCQERLNSPWEKRLSDAGIRVIYTYYNAILAFAEVYSVDRTGYHSRTCGFK